MGSITETKAGVGCAYFRGRGLEKGFTIKAPYTEYLSCTVNNTNTENGILAIYNYDLADRAYLEAKDTIAFQIYTKLGANAANITTGKNIHALDVFIQVDADYAVATNLRNAKVRAARIQAAAIDNVSGSVVGCYISSRLETGAAGKTYLGRIVENSSSYGAIGLEVRLETAGTSGQTVTIGDGTVIGTQWGMCNILLTYNGARALTGNVHYIVMNIPYEGSAVSGETVGIKFVNQVVFTGTAFDKGIDFGSGMVVKAINVDSCGQALDADSVPASGSSDATIHITTTVTTGLSVANQKALYIETNCTGTGTVTSMHLGIHLETYVESGVTITAEHIGIYVATYDDRAGNQNTYSLRLEHNGTGVAMAFIEFVSAASKMQYLFDFVQERDYVGKAGTPGTQGGFIKVRVAGTDKWIMLYGSAS